MNKLTGDTFPSLEVSGTPFECGLKHGKELQDGINQAVEYILSLLHGMSQEAALRQAHKHLPFLDEYSPGVSAEMHGIAKGSGLSIDAILLISLHEELSGFPTSSAHACTAFSATGKATKTGLSYLCQTWDISPELSENFNPHIMLARRDNMPDTLSFSYPGMIAGAGLNSAGIAITWNGVPRLAIRPGVPTYAIIAEILRQTTIGDALAAIFRADRAGCFNFMIADETEIYSIEGTPDEVGILYSSHTLGHANHYVSDVLKNKQDIDDIGRRNSAGSIIRHYRVNRLLEEADGEIDLSVCQHILQDHVNYPQSICRHMPAQPEARRLTPMTCASWVISPSTRQWWVTRGPACENPFVQYNINDTS
jgi:isopenicillin-N N-acyltransferase like protein